jgi:hypothetical protein
MGDEGWVMESCKRIGKRIGEFAAMPATDIPGAILEHLADCPACTRALRAARLTRRLLAAAADGPEPPADFSRRVLAALPPPKDVERADPDLWRAGWRLIPAFTATATAFLILFSQLPAGPGPTPAGLLSAEAFSASEQLILGAAPPEPDLVLEAVMEAEGR